MSSFISVEPLRQTIAKDSPPVQLLSPLGAPGAYIAAFGWTGEGSSAPTLDTMWTANGQVLAPGRSVTLSTQMPDGTRYELKIAVDDGYLFTVDQRAINASACSVRSAARRRSRSSTKPRAALRSCPPAR